MKKKKSIIGFESRHQSLLSRERFVLRLAKSFVITLLLICISLICGMVGYHFFESLPWIDAFANAAMILSGMGPLDPMKTWGGKFFAGCYALYSGLALIISASVLLAPVVHRFMHRFHLETEKGE